MLKQNLIKVNCEKYNMKDNKAQVNQVFVYVFSIIIIVFAGFLVIKFISSFTNSADQRAEHAFYSQFEEDFYTVYTSYGSEKVYDYRVSSYVELVCFISTNSSIKNLEDDLKLIQNEGLDTIYTLYDSGARIIMFNEDTIINKHNPEKPFDVKGGSFCMKPRNNKFTLLFENIKNKVHISNDI